MTVIKCTWAAGADQTLGMPVYATTGAAGADLRANLPDGPVFIEPMARALVSTGLHMEIPQGFEVQIRPRSGLALKHGIMLPNSPGTIDSDYRGVVGVIVLNAGAVPFEITHGMRIAQMVVAAAPQVSFEIARMLDTTDRASGGFGSTGES
ncbi:dUTP diphosphatase [Sulfitobacter geojensis]|uniref:Deoxyuridine 5'-triphosphate nucleotidohydrolase n=1 Tax=Sulfitobacter geojensis TaxID=1342299 RepID=A0AAE3B708_9RHOB|nr:dUTP diphosphatase [Sulfitobacter geojensis]MBM1690452.1 dUTP diphosphatase [Sulfitobacter geojensis]MBM1694518.1 dUTP diphosphatase [Sulfitobacter geojensis]MBM1706684.1 dUTP diphosphatase [Sulfitobacter geojensis]MBM1710742.1 dUTP diphosphatase [Sulfitobacter geojensis]MBM1714808.1 dUTP diphosphatase [Sulfitobacter geojensis]